MRLFLTLQSEDMSFAMEDMETSFPHLGPIYWCPKEQVEPFIEWLDEEIEITCEDSLDIINDWPYIKGVRKNILALERVLWQLRLWK